MKFSEKKCIRGILSVEKIKQELCTHNIYLRRENDENYFREIKNASVYAPRGVVRSILDSIRFNWVTFWHTSFAMLIGIRRDEESSTRIKPMLRSLVPPDNRIYIP